jgi:hypothetical protein
VARASGTDLRLADRVQILSKNSTGTHGSAGEFGLEQLSALKNPIEDAIKPVYRIAIHAPRS